MGPGESFRFPRPHAVRGALSRCESGDAGQGSGEGEDGAAAEQDRGAEQMGAVGAMIGRAVGGAGAGQIVGIHHMAEIGQTVLGAHLRQSFFMSRLIRPLSPK